MSIPKAYYIDIDGTLTGGRDHLKLNYNDIRSIKAAARDGAHIILLTGRAPDRAMPIFEKINIGKSETTYIGCNNGSVIFNAHTQEVLKEEVMSAVDFTAIYQTLYQRGFIVKNAERNKYYAKKNFRSWVVGLFTTIDHSLVEFNYNNVSGRKIGCISKPRKGFVKKLAKEIEDNYPGVEVSISGPGLYIEITKKDVNKGNAIKFISELIDVPIEDSVHIGDSMNDLSAFKVVGTSVAMKNGMKALKKEADFLTKSQKKQGVSEAIDSLRQKRRK